MNDLKDIELKDYLCVILRRLYGNFFVDVIHHLCVIKYKVFQNLALLLFSGESRIGLRLALPWCPAD
jgi:hypothetical protein